MSIFRTVILLGALLLGTPHAAPLVTYAGDAGKEEFHSVARLSDGTLLVSGWAQSLSWIPAGVPRTPIAATGINSADSTGYAILLHLSADARTMLRCVHFPRGTVRDIRRIRTTEVPGRPTGDIYISGSRTVSSYNDDGYYIARLNGNFVSSPPTAIVWGFNVRARPRQSSGYQGTSAYKEIQPWDVGSDGKVVYGSGAENDYQWAEIGRLRADGTEDVVEHWPCQNTPGGEHYGPASSAPGGIVTRSTIILKVGRLGSLRSLSQADYDLLQTDENGYAGRKGRFPDDYYFSGPCDPVTKTCAGGPGYTGYRVSDKPTARLGQIAIDRRNNALYFGYNVQSRLPDGNPDFEPAVVAMGRDGRLRWWRRLYREQSSNSTPDQYVDAVAIDYASDTLSGALVVLARAHGNNTWNLWSGNAVRSNPLYNADSGRTIGYSSYHDRFTGTNGNAHYSWTGRLRLSDGVLLHAAYLAEYNDQARLGGGTYGDPNMDGWPSHNSGWPDLNSTRCHTELTVDASGDIYVACSGRRTLTTANAYQKMLKPSEGVSTWNHFVRAIRQDMSTLTYSSLLVGPWNPVTEAGGANVTLRTAVAIPGGLLVVGSHDDSTWRDAGNVTHVTDVAKGNPVPVADVPAWGSAVPRNRSAFLAKLEFSAPSVGTSRAPARAAGPSRIQLSGGTVRIILPGREKDRLVSILAPDGRRIATLSATERETEWTAVGRPAGVYLVVIRRRSSHEVVPFVLSRD